MQTQGKHVNCTQKHPGVDPWHHRIRPSAYILNLKPCFPLGSANCSLIITFFTVNSSKLYFFFVTVPDPCPSGQALNEVKEKVEGGYRMEAPEDCPPGAYALMRTCWEQEPRRRPTFHKLRDKLEQEMGKHDPAPLVKDEDWDRVKVLDADPRTLRQQRNSGRHF